MRLEKPVALLKLARQLAGTAEGLTLDEIARDAQVDRRTAERMRDALRDLFPTFDEVADGRSRRFRIRGGLDGFLQAPSVDELAELSNAIKALEAGDHAARAELLRTLDDKIKTALRRPQRLQIEADLEPLMEAEGLVMQAGPKPRIDAETLAILREALKACRHCRFNYTGAENTSLRARVLRPYGLLFGKVYYLVGALRGRTKPVLWRLDRMRNLCLGEPFKATKKFDLAAFAARSFGAFQEEPVDVVLRFSPDAAPDAANFLFHPSQRLEPESDGALVVSFRSGGLLELVRHLFSWGDAVEIVAPKILNDLMVTELQRALSRHEGPFEQLDNH